MSILIIDDERPVAGFLAELLESRGYEVKAETDSRKALAAYQSDPLQFQLIITDQTMPGLTGVEIAQSILKQDPKFPIVLCTGFSDIVNEKQALDIGIRRYIPKPMEAKEILSTVKELLNEG